MRGPTVTQSVQCYALAKLGLLSGFPASDPYYLVPDRLIRTAPRAATGKQMHLRFTPAPVLAQGFQQRRTQRQIAALAAPASLDTDDHALAVNVADLQTACLGTPHPSGVASM